MRSANEHVMLCNQRRGRTSLASDSRWGLADYCLLFMLFRGYSYLFPLVMSLISLRSVALKTASVSVSTSSWVPPNAPSPLVGTGPANGGGPARTMA